MKCFIESWESYNSKLILLRRTKLIFFKMFLSPARVRVNTPPVIVQVVQETLEPFKESNNMRYHLKVSPKGMEVKSLSYIFCNFLFLAPKKY